MWREVLTYSQLFHHFSNEGKWTLLGYSTEKSVWHLTIWKHRFRYSRNFYYKQKCFHICVRICFCSFVALKILRHLETYLLDRADCFHL